MMLAAETRRALEQRLERLRERVPRCGDTSTHATRGLRIRRSPAFLRALRRVRALADEHRLLVVALLRRWGELCACEIQAATGLSHATVSHHMAILRAAGLVRVRRDGRWAYYRLTEGTERSLP